MSGIGTRCTAILVAAALLATVVIADEGEKQPEWRANSAADAVRAAIEAGADDDLLRLAESDDPDPWEVVDALCRDGHHVLARQFAAAAPRPATETLPAYVDRAAAAPTPDVVRAALDKATSLMFDAQWDELLVVTSSVDGPATDVARIQVAHLHVAALMQLKRWPEAAGAVDEVTARAESIGWILRAATLGKIAADVHVLLHQHALAIERALRAADLHRRLGASSSEAGALALAARSMLEIPDLDRARTTFERAGAILTRLGDPGSLAAHWSDVGLLELAADRLDAAEDAYRRAVARYEAANDEYRVAIVRGNLAQIEERRGAFDAALELHQQALTVFVGLGKHNQTAASLLNMGSLETSRNDYDAALVHFLAAIERCTGLGSEDIRAKAEANIGQLYFRRGEYAEARKWNARALARFRELGYRRDAVSVLNQLALVDGAEGRLDQMIATLEQIADEARSIKDRRALADAYQNIALAYTRLEMLEQGFEYIEQAVALRRGLGDAVELLGTLLTLAALQSKTGRHEAGIASLLHVLERSRALGVPDVEAGAHLNLGTVHLGRAEYEAAAEQFSAAIEIYEDVGEPAKLARALVNQSLALFKLERLDEALAVSDRALTIAIDTRALQLEADVQNGRSFVFMQLGRDAEALDALRRSIDTALRVAHGLDDTSVLAARKQLIVRTQRAILVAQRSGDARALFHFIEVARARGLLESLTDDDATRGDTLSDAMRAAIETQQGRLAGALRAYRSATRGNDRKLRRQARQALEAAEGELDRLIARAQREERAAASLHFPVPVETEAIQARLRDGDVLVAYHVIDTTIFAAVFTHDTARVGLLPVAPFVLAQAQKLRATRKAKPELSAVSMLRRWLISSLQIRDAKRLYVVPHGELAYVPFAQLVPESEVVMLPSATVFDVLAEQASVRGEGVLGLGDPDYGHVPENTPAEPADRSGSRGHLQPLPASGPEVESIADVVLLGRDATEARFRTEVTKRERWRAVHFACHGYVDPGNPLRSSLALTEDAGNDGFLTVGEILRIKIPADLVVLSACESGRGEVLEAEGIVGLARAFMVAGAPRVLCSLWKVDDAATRELMETFYGLWNPKDGSAGMPAAAALKAAQEHVRAQPGWESPFYWAAWVLWGLGD